jgi:ATP-dependent RNA helicase DeaD
LNSSDADADKEKSAQETASPAQSFTNPPRKPVSGGEKSSTLSQTAAPALTEDQIVPASAVQQAMRSTPAAAAEQTLPVMEEPEADEPFFEPAASEDRPPLPEYTLEQVPEALRAGFEKLGWTSLMPVQARAVPYILARRDLMIQSRTGSGKTGAYLIPLLQRINPENKTTQALVLVPTRELAQQVIHEAEILGSAMQVHSVAVYGGVGYGQQLEAFREGAHLVVGTPGRILDHLLRRSLNLDKLKVLIFDEADRMLSMGFYPDMKRVQRYLPRMPLNTYMFSATFPPRVLALSREFMHNPEFLNLSSDHVYVTDTAHVLYNVPPMDKERSLIRIIEAENPASALIFCNTRERVHFVSVILQRYGYNAAEISSDLSQVAREEVIEKIRQGQLRFLVATDVASRGIDIPELSHVIMYEVPDDPESYIHRAGRTGRAGASGTAISLVNAVERAELLKIGKRFQLSFEERQPPTEEEVQAIVAQRTTALLEAGLRERDRLQTERMQRFFPYLRTLLQDEEGLADIAMLLDDYYHSHFHTSQTPQPTGEAKEGAVRSGPPHSGKKTAAEPAKTSHHGNRRDRRPGDRKPDSPRSSNQPGEKPPARAAERPTAENEKPANEPAVGADGSAAIAAPVHARAPHRRRNNRVPAVEPTVVASESSESLFDEE